MYFFKSYLLIVVLMLLVATSSTVHAAFPMQRAQTTAANTETVASQTDVDFKALVTSAIEKFTQKPAPARAYSQRGESAGLGIASLATGLVSLTALLGVAFVALGPALITVSILTGIAAIILGVKGLNRPKRGFAVAGLILGIVTSSILITVILLTLLLMALMSGI